MSIEKSISYHIEVFMENEWWFVHHYSTLENAQEAFETIFQRYSEKHQFNYRSYCYK